MIGIRRAPRPASRTPASPKSGQSCISLSNRPSLSNPHPAQIKSLTRNWVRFAESTSQPSALSPQPTDFGFRLHRIPKRSALEKHPTCVTGISTTWPRMSNANLAPALHPTQITPLTRNWVRFVKPAAPGGRSQTPLQRHVPVPPPRFVLQWVVYPYL